MKRRRIAALPFMLATAVGGFVACTFGADDFKIVQVAASGGDGSGDSDNGGMESVGGTTAGSNTTGGTTSNAGNSSGGSSANGGAAGSPLEEGGGGAGPTLPTFLCAPQAEPFSILSVADLQMSSISQVQLAPSRNGAVVTVSGPSMAKPNVSRLVYRFVRDSNGGTPDAQSYVEYPNGRLNLAATMVTPKDELHVTGLDGNTIFEYTAGLPLNGSFAPGSRTDLDGGEYCNKVGGGMRDVEADYSAAGLGYAFTCSTGPDGVMGTTYELYLKEPGAGSPQAVRGPNDENGIIRRYLRVGQQNLLLVGPEVGPSLSMRYGDLAALSSVHPLALSNTENVFSSVLMNLFPSGLFVTGATFTTAPNGTPPLVPANVFAGEVDPAHLDALSAAVPPRPLKQILSYTKASQLVGIEAVMPVGTNRLGVGVHIATKDTISAILTTQTGELLAGPTDIYKTNTQIGDHSLNIVPLGLGALVVWAESGNIKGRLFSCLQD